MCSNCCSCFCSCAISDGATGERGYVWGWECHIRLYGSWCTTTHCDVVFQWQAASRSEINQFFNALLGYTCTVLLPSTHCRILKWVSPFALSNNNKWWLWMWMIADYRQTQPVSWLGFDVWQEALSSIHYMYWVNKENEWDHRISVGIKEGPADCIRINEVAAALKKIKRQSLRLVRASSRNDTTHRRCWNSMAIGFM